MQGCHIKLRSNQVGSFFNSHLVRITIFKHKGRHFCLVCGSLFFLLGYSICVPHHFHLITLATEPKVLSLVNFFMVNIWRKNWIVNKNGQIWNIGSNICAIFFEAPPRLLRTNKRLFVCLFAYNGQFSHLSNFFLSVTWPFHLLLLLLRYSLHFDTFWGTGLFDRKPIHRPHR